MSPILRNSRWIRDFGAAKQEVAEAENACHVTILAKFYLYFNILKDFDLFLQKDR
jgi:hypothetical protein